MRNFFNFLIKICQLYIIYKIFLYIGVVIKNDEDMKVYVDDIVKI